MEPVCRMSRSKRFSLKRMDENVTIAEGLDSKRVDSKMVGLQDGREAEAEFPS